MNQKSYRIANWNDDKSQDRSIVEKQPEIKIAMQIIVQIDSSEVNNLARNEDCSETR